ncbi:MAG: hypothetical protein IKR86_00670 [Candidatus Methanomethylophilaceae archaeon]|nr:hypothetical protein [Candidatus Methanomethylophilaceae archaeon]
MNLFGGKHAVGNNILGGVMRIGGAKNSLPARELDSAQYDIVGNDGAEVFFSKDVGPYTDVIYNRKCELDRDEGYTKVSSSSNRKGGESKKVTGRTIVQGDSVGTASDVSVKDSGASLGGVSIRMEDIAPMVTDDALTEETTPKGPSDRQARAEMFGDETPEEESDVISDVIPDVPDAPIIDTSSDFVLYVPAKSTGLRCVDPLPVSKAMVEEAPAEDVVDGSDSLFVISEPVPDSGTVTSGNPAADVPAAADKVVEDAPAVESTVEEVPAQVVEVPAETVLDEVVAKEEAVDEKPAVEDVVKEIPADAAEESETSDQDYVKDVMKDMTDEKAQEQEAALIVAIGDVISTGHKEDVVVNSEDSVPIKMDAVPVPDVAPTSVESTTVEPDSTVAVGSEAHTEEKIKPSIKGVEVDDYAPCANRSDATKAVVPEKEEIIPTSTIVSWDNLSGMSDPVFTSRRRRGMAYKDGTLVSSEMKSPLDDFDKSQAERVRRATATITRVEKKAVEEKKEPKISELVRPSARKPSVAPLEIKDEVVDVMRLAVPNIVSEEFGAEDLSEAPDDGIEALCAQTLSSACAVPSDGCPAVFSFGGSESAFGGIRFLF